MAKTSKRSIPALRFDRRLVLNQWMLRQFGASSFETLAAVLKAPGLEGFTEDNQTYYYGALAGLGFDRAGVSADILLACDQNIVRHWRRITGRRGGAQTLYPKYYQYLALLFTEIYLDRYFSDRAKLLDELNDHLEEFNRTVGAADRVARYRESDLNKLAFWSATGSGKTLVMHCNILQYQDYQARHRREGELNRIILLTPNEGLSLQHLAELNASGIQAALFSKDGRELFTGRSVEIIDVNKLREEGRQKTVAIDSFEGKNLVLVDEGHRGASGDSWKGYRDALSEGGFSFEYSATFGQAMKAANRPKLTEEYARCILFDYSYKYFYGDGYGKDYRIYNLAEDDNEEIRRCYLTACVLEFYQQVKLYHDRGEEFRRFLIERPLWVFVGGSVNAVRTRAGRQVSDVTDILLFLADFLGNGRGETVRRLDAVLRGSAGLRDAAGHELFSHTFGYVVRGGLEGEELFADILRLVFNAGAPGKLHVENLRGADGELALRVGENAPFGVINVGDSAALWKLCEALEELVARDNSGDFNGSLFRTIESPSTTVNMLIGSKKFSEGWNSWRVSTMGLMNIGRSEGSEIIQLFGRGVRLKGLGFCLKRSRHAVGASKAPEFVEVLETLNILGIRADYMRQFKEYLEEEGLPSNERRLELFLPTLTTLPDRKLKVLKLREEKDFRTAGPRPVLGLPDSAMLRHPLVLDWYPKIQAEVSRGVRRAASGVERNEGRLGAEHLAFLDFDAIWLALQSYRTERGWHNLSVPRDAARSLLQHPGWYRLYIPAEELALRGFDKVARWQELAIALLKRYCDAFYKQLRKEYEMQFLEYVELTEDDSNFFGNQYHLLVQESEQVIIEELRKLRDIVAAKGLEEVSFANFRAFMFAPHLYRPLIYASDRAIEIRPAALNEGERDFVADLQRYHATHREFFAERELYLLRNQSRGRGVGFFEAGNFYPDFILWLLDGEKQYITFVDPKGLRNLEGLDDPKVRFAATIKGLERELGDPNVILNSYILSVTRHEDIRWWNVERTVDDFDRYHHIVFQKSDPDGYIRRLLEGIVRNDIVAEARETAAHG